MSRIAIFGALRWECRPALRHVRRVRRRRIEGHTAWVGQCDGDSASAGEVWVVQTGPGMPRADAAARALLDHGKSFALFLSTGCAGALDAAFAPGDLVIADTVVSLTTGERFATDHIYRRRAETAAAAAGLAARAGVFVTNPTVLATVVGKQAAAAQTGALAVEMEGAAIAAVALAAGVPFAAVRTILDRSDTELPSFPFIDRHTGGIKPLTLAAYLAANPTSVPRLLALQRMMRAAEVSLERFFRCFLASKNLI